MIYLENGLNSVLLKKMNLDNKGTYWHIDHVIPVNKFKFNEDNKKEDIDNCFSWFNVMPIKGKDNMEKKDSINNFQIELHIQNLKKFCKKRDIKFPKSYKKLCATHLDAGTS